MPSEKPDYEQRYEYIDYLKHRLVKFIQLVHDKRIKLTNNQCQVSNNSFGSFWFSMVLTGQSCINCLASESFVVSFS